MAHCRQCNLLISGAAERWPRCGYLLPSRFRTFTREIIIIGLLIVVFAALRSGGSLVKEQGAAALSPKVVPPVPYWGPSKAQNDLAPANKCAKYEPAVVTLKGVVNIVQAYGPPNFGEDPAHDAKEPFGVHPV
jgi:hypothetical protein